LAVLSSINNSLQEIKSDNNILLNAEFNKIISDTIKNEPAPFIYERIGEKFRYYFIDEMQDTSILQWQNFIPLIGNALASENEIGEKGNLLLVGDAKQSIYRWRGGKPEQFIQLSSKEKLIANNPFFVEKDIFNLDTNYRSYSEIIEFNNDFFKHLSSFLSNKVNSDLYLEGNNQLITQKKGGFVQLSFIEKDDDNKVNEGIATKVYEIINDLESSFKKNEICVLVRTKKQGVEIANYLVSKNIEIISSETLLLGNSKKVTFIIDLLQTIMNPESNVYKIKLLYFLYNHLNIQSVKHEFIRQFLNLELDSFFKELEFYNVEFNLTKFNETPFYERFEYIIRVFNLTLESDANIQFFLDIIFEYQQKKTDSIYEFVEYWELKKDKFSIVAPENENAIRIMTIHKAKGLEFPVVIYPYDLDIYREQNHKIWYKYENSTGINNMLLSYGNKLKYSGEQGAQLYEFHREELEFDNFNLLYVTFTRAVEQLYLITEKKISTKNEENLNFSSGILISYLKKKGLWQSDKLTYKFGAIERVSIKAKLSDNTITHKNYISNSWNSNNISIVSNSSLLWETEKGESIAYGNLIHEMLSKIITENDIKEVLNEYVFNGTITLSERVNLEKVLKSVVNHSKLKKYFNQNNTILNEKEIVSIDKKISIPDRLIINKNEVVILDYKTGKPEKKHYYQLEEYAKLMIELGYKVAKKILVYINEKIIIEEF
jgi:ATP-dependent exoDNAse (exonuclease V) beta subunit